MLLIMDAITPLWLLLVPVAAALSWTACRWSYERKLRKLEHRLAKLNADRDSIQEQLKRARQQVGQLQKDLLAVQMQSTTPQPTHNNPRPASAKPQAAVKKPPEISGGLVFEAPQTAARGFADTMAFEDNPRP